jgi:hypothetical protein
VCNEVQATDTTPGGVFAHDPNTGVGHWSVRGEQTFLIAKDNTLIELGLGHPVLASIDPGTGAIRWARDLGAVIGAGTDTSGGWDDRRVGSLLVGSVGQPDPKSPGGAYGVDIATGQLRWLRPNLELCPLPTGDIVLLCGADGGIRRVDPATGKDLWAVADWGVPKTDGPWMGMSGDTKLVVGKTRAGRPITVAVANGAVTAPAPGSGAWMTVVAEIDARVAPGATSDKYLGLNDPVPTIVATGQPQPASSLAPSDIPATVGNIADGWHVFVDATGNLVAIPSP